MQSFALSLLLSNINHTTSDYKAKRTYGYITVQHFALPKICDY